MNLHRSITPILLMLLCTLAAYAEDASPALETGRFDVLLDLHGQNQSGSVVVPLAPLVHWLGASVQEVSGWTAVHRAGRIVYLQLPSGRADGLGALVRLRDVAEGLGAEVRFRGFDSPEAETLGYISHVELIDGERVARILLHSVPPAAVTEILAGVDRGDRCTGFLLHVSTLADDWAKTHEPQWHDDYGFTPHFMTGVLHRIDGRWQYAMRTSKISHTREELAAAGVPIEVARALGMEIED